MGPNKLWSGRRDVVYFEDWTVPAVSFDYEMKNTVLFVLMSICAVLFLLVVFSPGIYGVSVLQSFAVQIAVFLFLCSCLFFIQKKILFCGVSLVLAVSLYSYIFLVTVQPLRKYRAYTEEFTAEEGFSLKVVHCNVLIFNTDYDSTVGSLIEQDPDFISLQEVNGDWDSALRGSLLDTYPHTLTHVDESVFGLSVYSKYPLTDAGVRFFGNVPYLAGTIVTPRGPLMFISAHLMPPIGKRKMEQRNLHLKAIAREAELSKIPIIILGDFNIVPWAPDMVSFKKNTETVDCRNGVAATFPSQIFLFRVPIDYILHSKQLRCVDFEIIKINPSDHFGLYGELKLLSL
jgi:endonuclease/exonuclease/phosphatase (EEP) superfamily protein YafD